jgi:hypothetical protein
MSFNAATFEGLGPDVLLAILSFSDVYTVLSVSLVRIFYGGLCRPFTIPATGKSIAARYHRDETAVDFIGQ